MYFWMSLTKSHFLLAVLVDGDSSETLVLLLTIWLGQLQNDDELDADDDELDEDDDELDKDDDELNEEDV